MSVAEGRHRGTCIQTLTPHTHTPHPHQAASVFLQVSALMLLVWTLAKSLLDRHYRRNAVQPDLSASSFMTTTAALSAMSFATSTGDPAPLGDLEEGEDVERARAVSSVSVQRKCARTLRHCF